uniref:Uncharacterized protein n=1 Tax=Kwoniella dejecticola CBS 10117 TaxID=1296121 RepID=A0A1A6AHS6_9TREE|nr:uncharacterized protein I303_01448 [Kwoniella dejecticola CBS 10117]OBR89619.1 hypothetical protein I303_01448 [Kwoniella dejecticola CBS 10117]
MTDNNLQGDSPSSPSSPATLRPASPQWTRDILTEMDRSDGNDTLSHPEMPIISLGENRTKASTLNLSSDNISNIEGLCRSVINAHPSERLRAHTKGKHAERLTISLQAVFQDLTQISESDPIGLDDVEANNLPRLTSITQANKAFNEWKNDQSHRLDSQYTDESTQNRLLGSADTEATAASQSLFDHLTRQRNWTESSRIQYQDEIDGVTRYSAQRYRSDLLDTFFIHEKNSRSQPR